MGWGVGILLVKAWRRGKKERKTLHIETHKTEKER